MSHNIRKPFMLHIYRFTCSRRRFVTAVNEVYVVFGGSGKIQM